MITRTLWVAVTTTDHTGKPLHVQVCVSMCVFNVACMSVCICTTVPALCECMCVYLEWNSPGSVAPVDCSFASGSCALGWRGFAPGKFLVSDSKFLSSLRPSPLVLSPSYYSLCLIACREKRGGRIILVIRRVTTLPRGSVRRRLVWKFGTNKICENLMKNDIVWNRKKLFLVRATSDLIHTVFLYYE